jgi:hypothetical protein
VTDEQVEAAVDAALLARERHKQRGVDRFTAAFMAAVALGTMLAGGPAR